MTSPVGRWLSQDAAIAQLNRTLASATQHHAWIFSGPKGVGKAGIATEFALALLAGGVSRIGDPALQETMAARLIAAGTHPDFIHLMRLEKDNKKGEGAGERVRNISAAQVRGLSRTLSQAPSLSSRRVILIDAADDMDRFAANALLKNLEEPPRGTAFVLIAHAAARLLPTIRSRCHLVRFAPMQDADVDVVLSAVCPDVTATDRHPIVSAAHGSVGHAIALATAGFAKVAATLDRMLLEGDASGARRSELVSALTGKEAKLRFEMFLEHVPDVIARHARQAPIASAGHHAEAWTAARKLAGDAVALNLDPASTVFSLAGLIAGLSSPPRASAP